ncbi:ATP-binding cassette domain-containing protein [Hoylesella oralis]|uniref:ATP-binding cassette domain-containing protein n=1 Tax=Hoylesella oralis TaxID=28134 RepID=UPI0028F025FC|nr:ATP-binding cassette domain-containing protein [Hoylesella oralis]
MLEMKEVCLNMGGKQLFNSLSFTVKEGDTLCVSGLKGCGKTTLLRTFMGLQQAESGYTTIDGELITPLSAAYFRQKMAYLPQDLRLQGTTVAELFMTFAALHANEKQQFSKNKLFADWKQLGVDNGMWGRKLSDIDSSTLQRILLSVATAPIRSMFLLDEPTSEQDDDGAERIKKYLTALKNDTSIMIIATNDERIKDIFNKHIVLGNQS